MFEFFAKNFVDICLLAFFLIAMGLMIRSFLRTNRIMNENAKLRKKIQDIRSQINEIHAKQQNEKIKTFRANMKM